MTAITLEIPEALLAQFDATADFQNRSRAGQIREAMKNDTLAWQAKNEKQWKSYQKFVLDELGSSEGEPIFAAI